ncbi:hypothetical protein FB382_003571 [Nocardioides ginsengisegetis]|uniref:L,D-transpeptidase catalytic domain n=1 Tax=Nocardioides ginsengisegetis TaxID=661491 RepID=A0A7W3J339_9ACTN|nr:hypothetical protein [Nocardioides ginsengisegetis]MBA8805280.1 hypothetical protein [Nocardioides ginsengisegetis]
MRRLVLLLLPLLLLGTTTGPPSYAGDGATDRRPVRALITFDKDAQHPWDSRVVWRAYRQDPDDTWEMTERREWRAGSGFGGPDTTHECVRNRGWLPNGRYSFVQHDDYAGSLIHGRVFFLGAKACRNGTVRRDLFIHTETGAGNQQCADTKGDQICRWEWPKINDYRSAGCIKMAPRDLLALTRHFHRYFDAGVRYARHRVQVKVIP